MYKNAPLQDAYEPGSIWEVFLLPYDEFGMTAFDEICIMELFLA